MTEAKIRIGGLMRCCIDTFSRKAPENPQDGDTLACDFCDKKAQPTMVFRDGAWEWSKAQALRERDRDGF